ncbi:MAG TPA: hypothetical protein VEI83_02670 [Acidimicrobiales bacterium]|nr:hypothetical protein [Acidimicrobiales bacterium]
MSAGAAPPARAARPVTRSRARRAGALAGVVAAIALSSTACASSAALDHARQACGHVDTALRLYAKSQAEGSSPQAAIDAQASVEELRAALPIASIAAGQSAKWQALMATLSESERVPEAYLVHALSLQCAATSGSSSI